MKILVTHNGGGVGKTSVSVHLAGVFLERFPGEKTLLVDCDDQKDSWRFFARQEPEEKLQIFRVSSKFSVIYNECRQDLKSIISPAEFDNILIDMDTPQKNTIRVMLDNDPDIIIVPISTSQKSKSLGNLHNTLSIIRGIEEFIGYSPITILLPLGVKKKEVEDKVCNAIEKPQKLIIAPKMRNIQQEMQVAVYEDFQYIWEYPNHTDLFEFFSRTIGLSTDE